MSSVQTLFSNGLFLAFVAGIPTYAAYKKVRVYDSFVEGAKGGFQLILTIFPYLLAMFVAIGMFRASGAIDWLSEILSPILDAIGMPADVLPLALVRPLSGSAANAILADIVNTHGGDDFVSLLAATMMGSTETTFYVIAIYFGAVNIQRTRHAIPAGLFAEVIGILASIVVVHWLY